MNPRGRGWPAACAALAALGWAGAQAQAKPVTEAPTEQAKRQADSPFRWIMINGAVKEKRSATPPSAKAGEATAIVAPAPGRQGTQPVPALPSQPEAPAEEERNDAAVVAPQPVASVAPPPVAVESPLRVIHRQLPEPPERLISSDRDDRVMVQFTVLSDGSVTGVRVAHSTNARLNPHVISAVEQWKYGAIDTPRNTQAGFVFRR